MVSAVTVAVPRTSLQISANDLCSPTCTAQGLVKHGALEGYSGEPEPEMHPVSGVLRSAEQVNVLSLSTETIQPTESHLARVIGTEDEDEQEVFVEDRAAFAEEQLQQLTARLQKQSAMEKELAKLQAELEQEKLAKQQLLAQLARGEIEVKSNDIVAAFKLGQQEVPVWVSEKASDASGHLERITAVCAADGMSPSQKLMICEVAAQAALDVLKGLGRSLENEAELLRAPATQPEAKLESSVEVAAATPGDDVQRWLQKVGNVFGLGSPEKQSSANVNANNDAEAGRLSGDAGAGSARQAPRAIPHVAEPSPVRTRLDHLLLASAKSVNASTACQPGDFAAGATSLIGSGNVSGGTVSGVAKRVLSKGRTQLISPSSAASPGSASSVQCTVDQSRNPPLLLAMPVSGENPRVSPIQQRRPEAMRYSPTRRRASSKSLERTFS